MNDISNTNTKYKILYSSYGYVKVDESLLSTNTIVPFLQISSQLTGTINKNSLSSEIPIRIKTLYGSRKEYTFTLSPEDKIGLLIKEIQKAEDKDKDIKEKMNKSQSYRIISTKGLLKELNLFSKVYEEKLSMNQLLILAPNHPMKFSDKHHGDQIAIEHGNIAHKSSGDDLQLALIDKGYYRDVSYTEFILETEPDERGIIIGVSLARDDYGLDEITKFWGYILSDGCKVSNDTQKDYGKVCKLGDKIGVLMEFNENNNTLSVSFFVNGENQGVAFEGLEKNVYFPSAVLYYEGTKVKVVEHSNIPEEKGYK